MGDMSRRPRRRKRRLPIVDEIEEFLSRTTMSPLFFGRLAVRNPYIVPRLQAGGDLKSRTEKSLRRFMRTYVPTQKMSNRIEKKKAKEDAGLSSDSVSVTDDL